MKIIPDVTIVDGIGKDRVQLIANQEVGVKDADGKRYIAAGLAKAAPKPAPADAAE
ncbi:MAG: hypothetical protein H6981_07310 [Gammaproteobacteria bacterium]|nr:hypothetical protein [Gammaproteobacteria bacterium]